MRAGKSRHWLIEPRPSCKNTRVGLSAAAAMRRYSRLRPRMLTKADGLDADIDCFSQRAPGDRSGCTHNVSAFTGPIVLRRIFRAASLPETARARRLPKSKR